MPRSPRLRGAACADLEMRTQAIYHRLPLLLQHASVSLRGLQLKRLRYSAHTRATLRFLLDSDSWSEERFAGYQLERLRRLVAHARCHSPYYAERYAEAGLDEEALHELDDIRKLPIVSKDDIRRHGKRFVSTHLPREKMWTAFTSGTTGTPLAAYHTHRDMQARTAFMQRLAFWYGLGELPRRASFTGKLIVDPDLSKPPFHRTNLALRQQLYSSHHLRTELLASYVAELASFQPQQIDGIASPIYAVADHMLRSGGWGTLRPSLIVPTSETLWPHIRRRMEEAYAAPVANQYGSQEGAPLAYECPWGGFHVCPESGVFEVLAADGGRCPPGRVGRLVVTSFLSEGMPLIRYDIGDLASWREGRCPCGRAMPMLTAIEGRIDDMFFTVERGIVPRVDSAFKSLPSSIVATQVAQLGIDRFEVRIIPDRDSFEAAHADVLVHNLHQYLGGSVRIESKLVDELPRAAGGKLRAMVNECSDPAVRNAIADAWNLQGVEPAVEGQRP